jgi:methionine aminopeptidase
VAERGAPVSWTVDKWKHHTYRGDGVHPKHPKKEVNDALDYANQQGFEVERTVSGHKWGRIKCTCGAVVSIWSTPKSPHNHGRQLRRWVHQHDHDADQEGP